MMFWRYYISFGRKYKNVKNHKVDEKMLKIWLYGKH